MITDSREYSEFTGKSVQRKKSENERLIDALKKVMPASTKADSPVVNVDAPVVNVTVPTPKVVVENNAEPFPDKLVFDIVRDKNGLMTQVIMRKPK